MTIAIENFKYKAIFSYEDLTGERWNSTNKRIIWAYEYLKSPYESFNRKEREIIDNYIKSTKPRQISYETPIYSKSFGKDFENIRTIQKKLEFVTDDIIEEMEFINTHIPKSQILK